MSNKVQYIGSNKKEIWDAYKLAKSELESLNGGPVSTTEKAKTVGINNAIESASTLDIDAMDNILSNTVSQISVLKDQYQDILTAIEAKKTELKDVHGIEVSANDLVALAEVKKQLIEDTEARAKELMETADSYRTKVLEESRAKDAEIKKERKREEEQYTYNTKRSRSLKEDIVDDDLREKARSLDAREDAINIKIKEVLAREETVDELENTINKLEVTFDERVAVVEEEAKNKANRSAQFQQTIKDTSSKADVQIANSKIESLQLKVEELQNALAKSEERVAKSNDQVAEMAKSALTAQADAATVAKITEVAAGNNQKR